VAGDGSSASGASFSSFVYHEIGDSCNYKHAARAQKKWVESSPLTKNPKQKQNADHAKE
jgi:hypothetical protein